ncbi:MAG: Hsp70 family protein, partial [Thermoguttaceae bacterium]
TFSIRNVNSHSLGVVGIDPLSHRRRNAVLIRRNTPLPATATRIFKTSKAAQRSILVEIVEGESQSADDCTPVGRCSVSHLPAGLEAGAPIKVKFHYRANGRLKVGVIVPHAERSVETEIVRENGLSKELLDRWREHICGLGPSIYQ